MKPLVIIPAYNLEPFIGSVVEGAKRFNLESLVVDDGSTDGTAQAARKAGAEVLRLSTNGGKGSALRQGFAWALHHEYNPILTMDGDGQHDPADLPAFLKAFQDGARFVVGDRMSCPEGMPRIRRWTNRWMSCLLSLRLGKTLEDTQCGFRLMDRDLLAQIKLSSNKYEIDSEILFRAAACGVYPTPVKVRSIYGSQSSRIRPVRDTFRFLCFFAREMWTR